MLGTVVRRTRESMVVFTGNGEEGCMSELWRWVMKKEDRRCLRAQIAREKGDESTHARRSDSPRQFKHFAAKVSARLKFVLCWNAILCGYNEVKLCNMMCASKGWASSPSTLAHY